MTHFLNSICEDLDLDPAEELLFFFRSRIIMELEMSTEKDFMFHVCGKIQCHFQNIIGCKKKQVSLGRNKEGEVKLWVDDEENRARSSCS